MRSDHSSARKMYETFGLHALRLWHSLPYVDIFENTHSFNSDFILDTWAPTIFDSAVVRYNIATEENIPTPICFLYANAGAICFEGNYFENIQKRLNEAHPHRNKNLDVSVVIPELNVVNKNTTEPIDVGPIFLIHSDEVKAYSSTISIPPCLSEDQLENITQGIYNSLYGVFNFLHSTPNRPVEVSSPPLTSLKSKAKADKTKKICPWLRDDLPRIIMMDPHKSAQYGHRIDRGGTHASPIPHQRRGHWATLRSERFKNKKGQQVFVRPTWIGDKEWIFNGSTYRVIDTCNVSPQL